MISSQTASASVRNGASAKGPALFMSTEIGPSVPSTSLASLRVAPPCARSAPKADAVPPSATMRPTIASACPRFERQCTADTGALAGELQRDCGPGAGRRAGDQRNLALQARVHHGSTSTVQIDLVFDLSRYFS